jgi:hypothetical protein
VTSAALHFIEESPEKRILPEIAGKKEEKIMQRKDEENREKMGISLEI